MNRIGAWAVVAACLVMVGCAPIESEVEFVDPAPDTVTASATFDITVDFDHAMEPETISTSTFVVTGSSSGTHSGTFTFFANDTRVVFTTTTGFVDGETVTVRLTDAIESRSDKKLDSFTWTFQVAPTTPVEPSPLFVQSMTPPIESNSGILTGNFAVSFNAAVAPSTVSPGVITIEGSRSGQRDITFDSIITSLPVPTLPFTIDRPFLAGERVTLAVSSDLNGFTGEIALPSVVQFTARQQGTELGALDVTSGSGLVGGHVLFLDVDLDGLDEWATIAADGTIVVQEESGGSVSTIGNWNVGESIADAAIGDFDGDGRVDIVVLTGAGNSLWLLLGSPSNALPFELPQQILLDRPAIDIVVGHLNPDGIPDLLLWDALEVSVAAGDAAAPFAAQSVLPSLSPIAAPAIGDFDGDGLMDVAVAVTGGNVTVLIGHDDGTFGDAVTLTPTTPATGVVAASLDGDALIDLIATAAPGQLGTAFLPTGAMTFDDIALFADAAGTGARVVDFDGDGKADLIAPVPGTSDLRIALGTGDGNLELPFEQSAPAEIAALALGDTDGDTILDFAIVHPDGSWGIGLGTTTNPTLSDRVRVTTPSTALDAGDLDVPFDVLVDNERDLQGLTLVLDYDPALLAVSAWTATGTDIGDLSPAFLQATNDDVNGVLVLGVIFELLPSTPPVLLPIGTGHVAATGLFDVAATAPTTTTDLAPVDGLGSPAQDNSFVSDGLSYAPELVGVTLDITANPLASTDAPFIRGDANFDGAVNVADGSFLQSYLISGGTVPPCLDAADANDDGQLNIADVAFINAYLFTMGPPPLSPFPLSGSDPTTDLLDCSP